jgi:hypothetical protein
MVVKDLSEMGWFGHEGIIPDAEAPKEKTQAPKKLQIPKHKLQKQDDGSGVLSAFVV